MAQPNSTNKIFTTLPRKYTEINEKDPHYEQKTQAMCTTLKEHILEDFKPAFGDTLQDLVKQDTPAKQPIKMYRKQTERHPAN